MKKAALILLAVLLMAFPATVFANTRTPGGGDVPYYVRVESGLIAPHTDEWAAIVFYRPAECVPDDFNLFDFFDFSASDCIPATTDGFFIWSGEPWISDPIQVKLHGLGAVPVWFVNWQELQAAAGDDILTIAELEGLPSLIRGSAFIYTETLHPTGTVKMPMLEYEAKGTLEDGRSFFVHALLFDRFTNVVIEFR